METSGSVTQDQCTCAERKSSPVIVDVSISSGLPEDSSPGEVIIDEDLSKWGPLRAPVNVKLADLGNACWVVCYVQGIHVVSCLTPLSSIYRIVISQMTFRRDNIAVLKCSLVVDMVHLLTCGV